MTMAEQNMSVGAEFKHDRAFSLDSISDFFRTALQKSWNYLQIKREITTFLDQAHISFVTCDQLTALPDPTSWQQRTLEKDGETEILRIRFCPDTPTPHQSIGTQYSFSRLQEPSQLTPEEQSLCECVAVQLYSAKVRSDEKTNSEREIRYFKRILDVIPHCIICISSYNADPKFSFANSLSVEILKSRNLPTEDIHKFETIQQIVHPDDQATFQAAIKNHLATSQDLTQRLRMWNINKFTWVCLRLRCIRNQHNQVEQFLFTSTDIEQEMELEKKIAYNTAKSKFLAVMSHEIKTPISCISGLSSLLQETTLSPEQFEYIKTIKFCSEELSSLVDNILEYAKLDQGKIKLHLVEVDVLQFTENVIRMFRNAANVKGITIRYFFKTGFPRFLVFDELRVRQILINLISNAIKFSDPNTDIFVEFGFDNAEGVEFLLEESCPRMNAWIKVTDNGIGMSEEFIKNDLFRSFCQADLTTSRKYGGSGLGLAICKSLVELMEGSIGCTSKETEGTTFKVCIPLDLPSPTQTENCPIFPGAFYTPKETSLNCQRCNAIHVLVGNDDEKSWIQYLANLGNEVIASHPSLSHFKIVPIKQSAITKSTKALLLCDEKDFNTSVASSFQKCIVFTKDVQKSNSDSLIYWNKPLLVSDFMQVAFEDGITRETHAVNEQRRSSLESTPEILPTCILSSIDATTSSCTLGSTSSLSTLTDYDPKTFPFTDWKVLIAEDNLINQKILLKMLQRLDIHNTDVTPNGLEAFLQFTSNAMSQNSSPYQCILMDISMPEMDGFSCSEKIVEFCTRNSLPLPTIVAISAHSDLDEMFSSSKGIQYMLKKPIKLEKLAEVLRNISQSCEQSNNAVNIQS